MADIKGSRQDQYEVSVTIYNANGQPVALGVFDTFEGGGRDSEETSYKPGGMAPAISLGGSTSRDNATCARIYDHARDHPLVPFLDDRVGKAAAIISKQPLDRDGVPFGDPLVYTGTLKKSTPPEHDSTSSDEAKLELEFTLDETLG